MSTEPHYRLRYRNLCSSLRSSITICRQNPITACGIVTSGRNRLFREIETKSTEPHYRLRYRNIIVIIPIHLSEVRSTEPHYRLRYRNNTEIGIYTSSYQGRQNPITACGIVTTYFTLTMKLIVFCRQNPITACGIVHFLQVKIDLYFFV